MDRIPASLGRVSLFRPQDETFSGIDTASLRHSNRSSCVESRSTIFF